MNKDARKIIKRAADLYLCTVEDLTGGSKRSSAVEARRIAIAALREKGLSLHEIKDLLNMRNHTSVAYHLGKHDEFMRIYKDYKEKYQKMFK